MKLKEKADIDGKTENVRNQPNNSTKRIIPRIVIEEVDPVPVTVKVSKSNRRIKGRTTITKIDCKINAKTNITRLKVNILDSANKAKEIDEK